jgi:hypothetical protein
VAKHPAVVPIVAATIRLSEASCSTICRKLFTIHECVTQSHNWSIYEKDKASVLLREIMRRCEWHGVSRLLQGAKAVFGPWCGIEGRNGAAVFPELRWCDLPARIVCYRAGLSAPLATSVAETTEFVEARVTSGTRPTISSAMWRIRSSLSPVNR